jgi:hypothetical protein
MINKSMYYVYAYLREDGTPYYVGKGQANRAWQKHRNHKVPADDKIVILESDLTEVDAFRLEKEYIAKYGRKDLGTGILRNMTDGGDGIMGHKHSEETKKKIALARVGKPTNLGKKMSEEQKEKLRQANLGKKAPDGTGAKISAAKKGKPGKPRSPETRAKMIAAQLARWAEIKRNQEQNQ